MAQQPIELILLQQWASYMAVPMAVIDAQGNLLYYNESAGDLVGQRFDELDDINAKEFSEIGAITDLDGEPVPSEGLPLFTALTEGRLAHLEIRFRGLDGEWREMESAAFPIIAQGGRLLGAVAFWEGLEP